MGAQSHILRRYARRRKNYVSPDANEFLVSTFFVHDTLIPGRRSDFEQSTGLNLCLALRYLIYQFSNFLTSFIARSKFALGNLNLSISLSLSVCLCVSQLKRSNFSLRKESSSRLLWTTQFARSKAGGGTPLLSQSPIMICVLSPLSNERPPHAI